MEVEVIEQTDRLEAISEEWDDLWRRDPNSTPFQSPHWLLPWWRTFGTDRLFTIGGRENGSLEAMAPLYILSDEESGETLGIFLGTGITDYLDVLLAPGASMEAIVDVMTRNGTCATWDLQQLRPVSPLLRATPPDGWSESSDEQDACPVLRIDGAGDDLQSLLSTHSRKKLRYYRRSLEREGALSFEQPSAESLQTFMTALFDLHAARWQQ
ncbi:MAG: GNAT family N-acetyltransferase [Thermoanaerobaculia bacterium]